MAERLTREEFAEQNYAPIAEGQVWQSRAARLRRIRIDHITTNRVWYRNLTGTDGGPPVRTDLLSGLLRNWRKDWKLILNADGTEYVRKAPWPNPLGRLES